MIENTRLVNAVKWADRDRSIRDPKQRREVEDFLDQQWPKVQSVVTEAIQLAGIRWMWEVGRLIETGDGELREALEAFTARESITFTTVWYNVLLNSSSIIASRVEVPLPQATICHLCGRMFPPELISPSATRYFGDHFCEVCTSLLWPSFDGPSRTGSSATADRALQRVAEILGGPVASKLHTDIPYRAVDAVTSGQLAAAAACCAAPEDYRSRHSSDWTGVLFTLGILKGPTRRGRGTLCVAADGHPCRSILERTVDDFLHLGGINHETEPLWPAHPVLNASGRKRADWLIGDGVMVEMAGLLSDGRYAERMDEKIRLAAELDLRLIVLTPASLGSLSHVFAEWLPASTSPRLDDR